jgi:hypothetical protein
MCWKKIWDWITGTVTPVDPPIPPAINKKIALLFAINDYPGSQNDLNGCINDQNNVSSKLPDFEKRKFKNSQVTVANFKAEILKAADETTAGDKVVIHYSGHGTYLPDYNGDEIDGKDEALYLYNGALVDDQIGELLGNFKPAVEVIIFLDSCFSESATRALNMAPNRHKGKFKIYKGFKDHKNIPHKRLLKDSLKWVVFSGCSEHETSADAFLNGTFNGAFTYYLMECIDRNLTYKEWYAELRKSLPSPEYDQTPTLDGPGEILNKKLFT